MTYPTEQPYPGETEEHRKQREAGAGPDQNVYHTETDDQGNTVVDYDMDAEDIVVTPGAHVDWAGVVTQMIEIADRRLGEQIPYVHSALVQFQSRSGDQIAQFVKENTPAPSAIKWGALVEGLISGVAEALFPAEAAFSKIIFETASKFLVSNVENAMESESSPIQDARQKLEAGVRALVAQVDHNTMAAVDNARAQVPGVIKDALKDEQHPSNDPAWVEEMVHWLGFPERTEGTVTAPVLQWLDYQFTALLQEVHTELVGY